MHRYFPDGINCIGANAKDVSSVVATFKASNSDYTAKEMLAVAESILRQTEYSEEVLVAFGMIAHLVKQYDDSLLIRFRYWLENYASNWAHVDDLCTKTAFKYLMTHPHLIEETQAWSTSKIAWCRRASNVIWVKFVSRKMGSSVYSLKKRLIFENCDRLMHDKDEFVQKSIGWLLKVSSQTYEKDVIAYIKKNHANMQRTTIRYALEKIDKKTRNIILLDMK